MNAIGKRILKLEGLVEAAYRRRAPRMSEILRERYVTMRAAQGLPPAERYTRS